MILIVADNNTSYWTGEGWSHSRENAREYPPDKRDVAMGLAHKLGAKAFVHFGTPEQRALGDVLSPILRTIMPEIEESPKTERKQVNFNINQLTLDNYEEITGHNFRLTKAEKEAGLSRQDALRRRIQQGEIKL